MGTFAGRMSGFRSPFSHRLWITAAIKRSTPRVRWNFTNGWISKLAGPSLNATGNDVAIESITIVHEGLKRIK